MVMDVFCERLKSLRGNTTQTAFAGKIGVSQNSYSRYEAGERIPGINVLAQIAQTFGVSADWLLGIGTSDEISTDNIPKRDGGVSNGEGCADPKDTTIAKQAESIHVQADALSNQSQALIIHAQTLNNNSQAMVNSTQAMVNNSDSIKSLARTLEASIGCPKETTT
jgi:Predicted transcriptional regulators